MLHKIKISNISAVHIVLKGHKNEHFIDQKPLNLQYIRNIKYMCEQLFSLSCELYFGKRETFKI